jgi:hypothetical protein
MANAWNEGDWGLGNYGEQNNITIEVTGVSATSTAGTLYYAGPYEGWGRLEYGSGSWGIAGSVLATGQQLTSGLGSVTVDAKIEEGWGRGAWGNRAWGDTYSALATGQELTSAQGTVIPRTDVSVTAASQQLLTLTQGQESIQIDADIFVFVSEHTLVTETGTPTETGTALITPSGVSATTAVGQAVGGTIQEVPVTGISSSLTLGTITLVQSTNESVTGQAMTLGLGTPAEIPQQMVGVTGQQLTSGIGSVSITGTGKVNLTGINLTASVGELNISAWQEIDVGVNNVWTEVDLAA